MKLEEKLDKEFEKMGVKPRIYHFTDVHPFSAITVVTYDATYTWKDIASYIWKYTEPNQPNRATRLLHKLGLNQLHGVAICDRRDNFSRMRGRIIAKGRLLKYLKKIEGIR